MSTKLVTTKDYLFWIDEKAEIKEGDLMYDNHLVGLCTCTKVLNNLPYSHTSSFLHVDKVIAYYPLTKEAKELDLPLLPPFEEIDIEKIAKEKFPLPLKIHNRGSEQNRRKERNPPKGFKKWTKAFIAGYKAAQSKQFSLEDMVGLSDYILKNYTRQNDDRYRKLYERDENGFIYKLKEEVVGEFTQSLSTQKLPKEFIPSVFYRTSCSGRIIGQKEYNGFSEQMKLQCKLYFESNNNSEGKEVLVGTYKY